jgi:hypothetical protein
MLRLLRYPRRRTTTEIGAVQDAPRSSPLPPPVQARIRLSADLLTALLEVERRNRATLDDLEWADAVADRMLRRRAGGRAA